MPSNDNPDLPSSLVTPPRRQTPAKTAEAVAPPPEPAPLLAANAALLSAKASAKRAAMKASLDPSSRKALQAEADELEGHAARLRDPATFIMAELHLGRGGEVSTLPDNSMHVGGHRDGAGGTRHPGG